MSWGQSARREHKALLAKWRKAMNLVGPGPVSEHFDDCRLALEGVEPLAGTWADLGSGAGFPGIPFASYFESLPVELVESRQKRCVFMNQVLRAAERAGGPRSAAVSVRKMRVEDLDAGAYAGVMSRAFAPPPAYLDHARRVLRPDGQVLLMLRSDQGFKVPGDFELIDLKHYELRGRELVRYWIGRKG